MACKSCFPQIVPTDDAQKSTVSYTVLMCSKQQYLHNKKRRPNREHRCGAGQIPSEGQVRISTQLWSARAGMNYAYFFLKVFGFYSGVESNSFACAIKSFPYGEDLH